MNLLQHIFISKQPSPEKKNDTNSRKSIVKTNKNNHTCDKIVKVACGSSQKQNKKKEEAATTHGLALTQITSLTGGRSTRERERERANGPRKDGVVPREEAP